MESISPLFFALLVYSAYTQPTHQIFGVVKDAENIYHCTQYQMRRLCVGGDMVIVFLVRSMVK